MADFVVPNYSDLINNLNPQIAGGPPKVDFSSIGNLPENYWAGLDQKYKQQGRDLFQNGVPSNPQDLVNTLAKYQGAAAAPQIMQYYKMLFGQQADQQINGGGPAPAQYGAAPSQAPQLPPSASNTMPRVANMQPGAPVPSSGRVMGDAEGVNSGIYDPPPAPGMRPPTQPDAVNAVSPNERVAQGFPSSGALVAPDASDPTLGGLVPAGRTPGQQRALLSKAVSSGMLEEGQQKLYQSQIDAIDKALGQYREGNVKNSELTPNQKDASSPQVLNFDTTKEIYKQDATAFQKDWTGVQAAGKVAAVSVQKAQLLKNATLDPNFYSGPLSEYVKTYRQFQSVFGSDPGRAAPAELFGKVTSDLLNDQIKSLAGSGVGRVLQAEVNNLRQGIATLGNTPLANRAQVELLIRTQNALKDIAEQSRDMPRVPGKMSASLEGIAQNYLNSHPLMTKDELQHPQLLGAPDAPPEAMRWTPQQAKMWGQQHGLKTGDPIRINGQIGAIPQ